MFFIALFIFYQYYSNTVSIDVGEIENVRRDAQTISNFLMSPGYPANWNSTDVGQIGIVEDGFRLNDSKLANLTAIDYDTTRKLFNTKYDYYFYFINKENEVANISAYGKPGINITNIEEVENPKKIVSLSRFVFYNKNVYRMVLNVWE